MSSNERMAILPVLSWLDVAGRMSLQAPENSFSCVWPLSMDAKPQRAAKGARTSLQAGDKDAALLEMH